MHNYLKYPPIRLRTGYEECVDSCGPAFSFAWNKTYTVAANKLTIRMPWHSPGDTYSKEFRGKFDPVIDVKPHCDSESVIPKQNWLYSAVSRRTWAFYGKKFVGTAGYVTCSFLVYQYAKKQDAISFFHPKAFEFGIADYLNSYYAHEVDAEGPTNIGPLNWQPVQNFPAPAARFTLEATRKRERKHYFCFPITDHHIAMVIFTVSPYSEKLSLQPMHELMENIIASIKLELSPEAQTQLDAVKAQCPDMSLSETFSPLKWGDQIRAGEQPDLEGLEWC
jgi:hypothetical protein